VVAVEGKTNPLKKKCPWLRISSDKNGDSESGGKNQRILRERFGAPVVPFA
jgi:hypothetical protein